MKTRKHLPALAIAASALAFAGLRAEAATISVQPSAAQVAQGSAFTVNLMLNATDAPGSHPGLYGGQVVLAFNPALLTYGGFTLASGVTFFSSPVVASAGALTTITLGFENATDVGRAGTYSFTAIGAPGSVATLDIADADNFFGTFVSYVPTYQPFYPAFVDATVQVVPLPGTAWLLVTAFGAVAARARRLAKAGRRGR